MSEGENATDEAGDKITSDSPNLYHVDFDFDNLARPDIQVLAAIETLPPGSTNRDIVEVLNGQLDMEQVRYRTDKLADEGLIEYNVDLETDEIITPKEYIIVYNGAHHAAVASDLVDEYGVELDESISILRFMYEAGVKAETGTKNSLRNLKFIEHHIERLGELEQRVDELEDKGAVDDLGDIEDRLKIVEKEYNLQEQAISHLFKKRPRKWKRQYLGASDKPPY